MDIGTGKDLDDYIVNQKSIPYYLIDILDPKQNYSVYDFQKDFYNAYQKIRLKIKYQYYVEELDYTLNQHYLIMIYQQSLLLIKILETHWRILIKMISKEHIA